MICILTPTIAGSGRTGSVTRLVRGSLGNHRSHVIAMDEIDLNNICSYQCHRVRSLDPIISSHLQQLRSADLLLVISPVYQAAYAGTVKIFLDLLPKHALDQVDTMAISVAGSRRSGDSLAESLAPVLQSVHAATMTALPIDPRDWDGMALHPGARQRVADSIRELLARRLLAPGDLQADPVA